MAAAACALLFLLQDKVALKFQPRAGDAPESSTVWSMKVEAKQGGATRTATARRVRRARTEFVEVADGRVAKKMVEVLEDVDEQSLDGQSQTLQKAMHKRKITVSYKDGAASFEGAQDLGEGDRKWLADGERFYKLLPKSAVALGDTWEITGRELDAVAEAPAGTTEGGVKLAFKAIRETEGRRCAVISMVWDVAGSGGGRGPDSRLKLDGEFVFWIERGYILSLAAKGEIVLSSGGQEAGRGPVTMEMTTTVK
jgi:hypothetical protein